MSQLSLADGQLDLWYAYTRKAAEAGLLRRFRDLLSEEERARAERFRFERDRRQFLVARALVRTVLSSYTGDDPRRWVFQSNAYGKPAIEQPATTPLHFNLSHTAGVAVCAVVRRRDVGVDVEDLERGPADLRIARRYFASAEADALDAMPEDQRHAAFLRLWTLKEAYVKARGRGLSLPLKDFAFALSADRPPAVSFTSPGQQRPGDWQFVQLRLADRYQVAAAVQWPEPRRLTICLRETVPLQCQDSGRMLAHSPSRQWSV